MKTLFLLTAVTLAAAALPALARPVTYECRLDVSRADNWVPEQVVIQHEPGSDTALVNDPLIHHFMKKPVEAKVTTDNDKRITFEWKLKMIKNKAGQVAPQFIYRATLQKADKSIRIKAIPAGYPNFFESGGTCTAK